MWFKKKSVLQAENHYNTEKSADNTTDLRTRYKVYSNTSSSINSGVPSAADAGNYFYLPTFGFCYTNWLGFVGYTSNYWSSSATPKNDNTAYRLGFDKDGVSVSYANRNCGIRVEALQ